MFDATRETATRDVLADLQWRRFRAMAGELLTGNAFIQRKWREAGITSVEDLRTWDDFRRLPLTRKIELVEVSRQSELDEVRVLVEVGDESICPALQEAFRVGLGIRLPVTAVPRETLPRWELKARRVVRREEGG